MKLKKFIADNTDYTARYTQYTLAGVYVREIIRAEAEEPEGERSEVYIFPSETSVTDSGGSAAQLPEIDTEDIIVLRPGTDSAYEARVLSAEKRRGICVPEYIKVVIR